MSASYDAKLIRMANQIATFFDSQPGDPVPAVTAHLRDFWDPSMRRRLAEIAPEAELRPAAREAALSL